MTTDFSQSADLGLVEFAHSEGRRFSDSRSREQKRAAGQFMTPPSIARFMAKRLLADGPARTLRLLEPAAGAGILVAAVVEEVLRNPRGVTRLEVLVFELDPLLAGRLELLRVRVQAACRAAGMAVDWQLRQEDFLLSELARGGRTVEGLLVIANPPFFKLNKTNDPRALAHAYAVHGQPNIYGLFMAACARLMSPSGRWCFITPRSWMAGAYFRAVRRTLLRNLSLDALHAFESRTEGFEADAVLQETIIAWAKGRADVEPGAALTLTRSEGADDIDRAQHQTHALADVVGQDEQLMLALPQHGSVLPTAWTARLQTYGLSARTGPVVAFRAREFSRESAQRDTVPFLWLQHVRQQAIRWPLNKKHEHIVAGKASEPLLVRNAPMVVMRRFSPKEAERRVTCAAYDGCLPGEWLGLENHLNFIQRDAGHPLGALTPVEAAGLSAFLASRCVDHYFRALAGSTQVNATELRRLPLPPWERIVEIGRSCMPGMALGQMDEVVEKVLGLAAPGRIAA
ncbi:Eco57I restriction-modification methylase domain-containing protein [Roseateles sp. P5_E7]